MMQAPWKTIVSLALAAATGWFMGARLLGPYREGPRPVDGPTWPTAEDLENATTFLSGRLSATARASLEVTGGAATVVVLLREADWLNCEDLGRQIRELQRASRVRGHRLVVWSDPDEGTAIATHLRRERITPAQVVTLDLGAVIVDQTSISTPAAILVGSDGQIIRGVSHTIRFPNVRIRSFAQELGLD